MSDQYQNDENLEMLDALEIGVTLVGLSDLTDSFSPELENE